ncbi:hypothetical protein WH50_24335 [Pokkaliibacter plantistimulans]|uniref:OmpA-like domain-containing protein n=2 Tax=Pokkaliibacter plantistimulans TaxID=1635171 RepID=A0ABX5LQ79_9GAMM|nr:hypothetical protein WH50_24335 [Pokkaliibacter plantistimulans]
MCGLLMTWVPSTYAVTFAAGMENTKWNIEASPFTCKLSQDIPAFGKAIFEHEAGEPVLFYLEARQRDMLRGNAELLAESPSWRPGDANLPIARVNLDQGEDRVMVASKDAEVMLAALYQGKFPTFNSPKWLGSPSSLKVQVSSVNFQKAYDDYQTCVAGLLPVNFRQIARTAVLFNSAGTDLSDEAKERLELISRYVKVDKSVVSIYIDGHTDSQGRRLQNRDLSKRRAQAVTDFLEKKGVPNSMIVTRFHGERYPVVDNKTPEHRARNRRVTIRLDKEAEDNGDFPEESPTDTSQQ